jgi:uncharacterized protein (DUF927 family)
MDVEGRSKNDDAMSTCIVSTAEVFDIDDVSWPAIVALQSQIIAWLIGPPKGARVMNVKTGATALDIARLYLERGWDPVPVEFRKKGPRVEGWGGSFRLTGENLSEYFNCGRQNIGVVLGKRSGGLTDIDLDCHEARVIASYVLPPTKAIFGRASSRNSHRLYVTGLSDVPGQPATIAFDAPGKGKDARLLEVRIGGEKRAQTIFPGSTHQDTGESILWEEDGEPAIVEGERLIKYGRCLGAACLLARAWPANDSRQRHEFALVVGGVLARSNFKDPLSAIKPLVQGICAAVGDNESRDRVTAALDAAKAFKEGKHAYGLPELIKYAGEAAAKLICEWFGYQGSIADVDSDEPLGFQMRETGLYVCKVKGDGENKEEQCEWVSSPFSVVQRERSPTGDGWARRLSWRDHDGREHSHLVADARLHSDPGELCGDLADNGLTISISKHRDLINYLNRKDVSHRGTIVERTGWHDIAGKRCFVLPDQVIGRVDRVTLQGSTSRPYAVGGTLEEWKTHVAGKVKGHRYLTFMLANGFVGPLLELLEMESGGVHPYGQSSIGKTTGVRVSVTPWGSGADKGGFLKSWSATRNGLEGAAVDHADTLLPLEEMGIANAKELGASVYSITSGLGKQRADRTGSLRSPKTWRTWMVSSGEATLRAMMAAGGQRVRAGQEIRILDIRADQDEGVGVFNKISADFDPKALADEIKLATCRYYGTAGPAFIAKLLEVEREDVKRHWEEMRQEIPKKVGLAGSTEQVTRVADKFAVIALAGELAIEFGVLPLEKGSVGKAAGEMLGRWVKGSGGAKDPQEITAGIAQIRRILSAYGSSRFEHADRNAASKDEYRPVHDRLGWFRGAGEDQRWFILPTIFRDVLCEGFDHTTIREALHDYGMLIRDPDGKHWPRNECCDGRTQRVCVLTARILQEEGAD